MEKVNIPGWGEPQIVRESQGLGLGLGMGFGLRGRPQIVKVPAYAGTYSYWCEPPGRLYHGDDAMVTMILMCRHISGSHEACYVHISSPAEGRHGSALRGDHWWWHPLLQLCQLGLLLCTTITNRTTTTEHDPQPPLLLFTTHITDHTRTN